MRTVNHLLPPDAPLFPLRLYVYTEDGFHDEGIEIVSEAQLQGPGVRLILQVAMERGVEIRMTDPNDFLVFHADKGQILFPTEEDRAAALMREK